MSIRSLLALALVVIVSTAQAAAEAVVEAVQSPAWVERVGRLEPLSIGMQLRDGDRVVSGAQGRVLLRLAEGSSVKLGEQAQLAIDRLALRREPEGSLMTAALDVLRGAFRFTTQTTHRFRGRREFDVRIATVTAGIRGTDIWGKAAADRDIVCLIEGRISVQRDGEAQFTMDQPLSFYIAPKNAPALPVQPVSSEQLAQWAAETEILPGQGGARQGGRWHVQLAQVDDQQGALAVYDTVRAAGYPARIRPATVDGRLVYRVRIGNLPDQAEAQALANRIRALPGLGEISVGRG